MLHSPLLMGLCQRVAMLFLVISCPVLAQTSGGLYAPDPPPGST